MHTAGHIHGGDIHTERAYMSESRVIPWLKLRQERSCTYSEPLPPSFYTNQSAIPTIPSINTYGGTYNGGSYIRRNIHSDAHGGMLGHTHAGIYYTVGKYTCRDNPTVGTGEAFTWRKLHSEGYIHVGRGHTQE